MLGYLWLATLGETRINWGLHIMKFMVNEQWVTISGDPPLLKMQVSLNSMEKLVGKDEVVFLLELQALFEASPGENNLKSPIENTPSRCKPVLLLLTSGCTGTLIFRRTKLRNWLRRCCKRGS